MEQFVASKTLWYEPCLSEVCLYPEEMRKDFGHCSTSYYLTTNLADRRSVTDGQE